MQEEEIKPQWIIRPATRDDGAGAEMVLTKSYASLLQKHYDEEMLRIALPLISKPRPQLLECGTWYVAVLPESGLIIGCGGWTAQSPYVSKSLTTTNDQLLSTIDGIRPVPHLRHFAVDPEYTRLGVATAIWERTLQDITKYMEEWPLNHPDDKEVIKEDKSNKRSFALEVYSTLNATKFYESKGFTTIKEVCVPLAEHCQFPSILMARNC